MMNFTCPTLLWLRRSRRNKFLGLIFWGLLFASHDYMSRRHLLNDFWDGVVTVILLLMAFMLFASFCSMGISTQQPSTQDEHHG